MSAERLDSMGVGDALSALPDAIRATVAGARDAAPDAPPAVAAVVLAASAASKLTAVAAAAIAAPRASVPVVTVVDDTLPAWARGDALILALDGGVTERLLADAVLDGVPVVSLGGAPDRRPSPITEVAATLAALEAFGLVDGVGGELVASADVVARRLDEAGGAPERLARRIGRTQPLVYGGGPLGAAAAASWKHSVNRNAKSPAFANSVPGLDHDEVCGWAQHGDVTRQVLTLVLLRHPFESADQAHRLDVTAETCDEVTAGVHTIETAASSPVAALFDLMLAGEMVSLEMAAQAGVDPGPTPVVDRYR